MPGLEVPGPRSCYSPPAWSGVIKGHRCHGGCCVCGGGGTSFSLASCLPVRHTIKSESEQAFKHPAFSLEYSENDPLLCVTEKRKEHSAYSWEVRCVYFLLEYNPLWTVRPLTVLCSLKGVRETLNTGNSGDMVAVSRPRSVTEFSGADQKS